MRYSSPKSDWKDWLIQSSYIGFDTTTTSTTTSEDDDDTKDDDDNVRLNQAIVDDSIIISQDDLSEVGCCL